MLLAAVAPCRAAPGKVARAQDFVDSIGINIHARYTDGEYRRLDAVIGALDELGIRSLRDQAPTSDAETEARFRPLLEAGYRFDFIVSRDLAATIARLTGIAERYPGSVEAIEGPNEVNNWPITFEGKRGSAAAVAFQQALYDAVKADPRLGKVPVYNFTDYPQPAGAADYMNLHPYPKRGVQPFAQLEPLLALDAPPMPGRPKVITEVGYNAMQDPGQWRGPADWAPVDEATQAILTANLLLDAFRLGAKRTYLYQLLDAYPDPQHRSADRHLGLYAQRYWPKPVADALRRLIGLVADDDPASRTFPLPPTELAMQGLPETAHSLLLQKAGGTDLLVVWNEPPVWDPAKAEPIRHDARTVTLDLGTGPRDVEVYDPVASAEPLHRAAGVTRLELPLSTRPLLVRLLPRGSGGAGATPPAAGAPASAPPGDAGR